MRTLRAKKLTSVFSGTVLALLFAGVWLGVQTFELWSDSWEAKVGQEAPVTVRLPANYFRITMLRSEFHYLSTASSNCPHLLPRGDKLERGKECSGLVRAFESARRPMQPLKLFGSFVFYLLVGLIVSAFMRRKNMGRARWLRSQTAVFVLLTVMAIGSKAILLFTPLSALVLPVAFVPLVAAYFLGRRVSFGIALSAALLTSSLVSFDIQVLLVHLLAGAASVLVLGRRKRVRFLVKGGAMAAWVAVLAAAVSALLFAGTLDIHDDPTEHLDPRYSLWLAALFSGLGAGLVALIVTPFVGVMVGEVSRGRLLDLQDLDHPLLRRLQERAPSTWAHSRAMANLAEAATHAIGGNALLVRVGAHFHDVGKCARPEYFIENQDEGQNPHDQLNPHESARAIFHHVSDGVRLLRQEGVPEDVIEFAYSHHGSSVLEFFWHKYKSDSSDDGLGEKDFRYPGHKPSTRESGILMLVDAVEAAARTVDQPDKSHFEQLVQRIVFTKLAQGQLDESGLSLADLRAVSNTLIDTLVSMYHGRIKYPWQTESKDTQPVPVDESGPQPVPPGSGAHPVVNGDQPAEPSTERASTPAPVRPESAPASEPVEPAPASAPAPEPVPVEPAPAPKPAAVDPVPLAESAPPPKAPPPKTDTAQPAPTDGATPDTFTGPAPAAPRGTVPGTGGPDKKDS
ncbi:MAG: HDIG domain-containing protein [Deltaproteobacteria bacterium]|nr:HDIG domain-containing protein [Deltaproteobacteria bacterium]